MRVGLGYDVHKLTEGRELILGGVDVYKRQQLLSYQGSLIVAIPAVHSSYRYLKVSHRIHSYRGNCCTV